MTNQVLPGAAAFSHHGTTSSGVLTLHGFTGNPSSVALQARALADAGHHVESPRLPGHGTTIDDMLDTGWSDWTAEVEAAYERLTRRASCIAVLGLSMGGTLALWTALRRRELRGIVCVNPLTVPPPPDVVEMVRELVAGGQRVVPGVGSDLADPDAVEIAYPGTPLGPLASLVDEGVSPIAHRYGEITAPLLLFTSRQDHVVDPMNSEHLAATHGGEVEHVWLERSYHVATQDYDRDDINERVLRFVARVTADRDRPSRSHPA
jgi:carboxylesterase